MNVTLANLPFFNAWLGFSGSIPDVYWNVWSEEQRYKWLCEQLCKLVEYSNMQSEQININAANIEDLAAELASMKKDFADEFEAYYKARICEWLVKNLTCIVSNAVKFVQFGLSETGNLFITIPNNWDFLKFYTDTDTESADYGKLQITY